MPVPILHRVVPDQFGNMLLACRELALRSHRRIGLVTTEWADRRTRHQDSAAHLWHATHEAPATFPLLAQVDQPAEKIGELGVEMLARQLAANAAGLPEQAQCVTVAGRFEWRG